MTDTESDFYFDEEIDVDSRNSSGLGPNIPVVDTFLAEVVYPANKAKLIVAAQEAEADETTLAVLHDIPDATYISEDHANDAIVERDYDE